MSIVAKSTAENSEYSIDALSKCFLLGNLPAIFTLQVCHFTRRAEELPRIRSSSRRAEYRDTRGGFNAARARNSKANEKASLSILIRTCGRVKSRRVRPTHLFIPRSTPPMTTRSTRRVKFGIETAFEPRSSSRCGARGALHRRGYVRTCPSRSTMFRVDRAPTRARRRDVAVGTEPRQNSRRARPRRPF